MLESEQVVARLGHGHGLFLDHDAGYDGLFVCGDLA